MRQAGLFSIKIAALCVGMAAAMAMSPAFGQTQAKPLSEAEPARPQLDPKACADRDRLALNDTQELESRNPRETMGQKLARTDGVICPPPDLDPAIRTPAPGGGNTPVIRPPADPSVQPK